MAEGFTSLVELVVGLRLTAELSGESNCSSPYETLAGGNSSANKIIIDWHVIARSGDKNTLARKVVYMAA